jgi:hypothetical protein
LHRQDADARWKQAVSHHRFFFAAASRPKRGRVCAFGLGGDGSRRGIAVKTLCDTKKRIAVALVHCVENDQQISPARIRRLGWTFDQLLPATIEVRGQALCPLDRQLPISVSKLMDLLPRRSNGFG